MRQKVQHIMYNRKTLPNSVTAAQQILALLILVRIQVGDQKKIQICKISSQVFPCKP